MTDDCDPTDREARLNRVLAAYLEAAEAGRAPAPDVWVAAHPEFRAELEEFLAMRGRVDHIAAPLRAPPVSDVPAQSELGGYELLDEIDRGGMGVVYRARQRGTGRLVALKIIRSGRFATAAERGRFRTEAEATAALDHPGIVPVYEVGEADGHAYYAMKLLEGGDLRDHLARLAADPRAAARLLLELAGAVEHAHRRGVLHRDLKPSNILLDADGQPHVADFGLAKLAGNGLSLTRTGEVVGTLAYMAPEQAAGGRVAVTIAVDVYGLGAVLYACLTGRPPVDDSRPLAALERLRAGDPDPPRRANPRVDRDLESVCLRCLERDPGRRYPSAGALADDLDRFLTGRPVAARRAGPAERLWRWARRRPAAAALALLAPAAALAGLGGGVWHSHALGRALAESDRLRGEGLGREAELRRHVYVADMADAKAAWDRTDLPRVRAILDRYIPAAGEEDLRGFEWYWLRHGCRAEEAAFLQARSEIRSTAVSPDGRTVATGHRDGSVTVWDLAARSEVRTFPAHAGQVDRLAFSPDGRTLASCGQDRAVRLWETAGWSEAGCLRGHRETVTTVAFSPDGRRLASAGRDHRIALWELPSGRLLREWEGHPDVVQCLAFTPDGRTLVSGGKDKTARLWDPDSGRELAALSGHASDVLAVAVSPDGRLLATGGYEWVVRVWDLATRTELQAAPSSSSTWALAFSPDGSHLAAGTGQGWAELWRVERESGGLMQVKTVRGQAGTLRSVAFLRGGKALLLAAEGGRRVHLWDVDLVLGRRPIRSGTAALSSIDASPVGRTIAEGYWDGNVVLSDAATGGVRARLTGHEGAVRAVAFRPGGVLATAGADRRVRLWDAATGTPLRTLEGHTGTVRGLAFSPDGGRLASASQDRRVRLWDPATGSSVATLDHGAECLSVAFSPDGGTAAVGCHDGSVLLWRPGAGAEPMLLARHAGSVGSVAFDPGGRFLASADDRGVIRVSELPGGRERATLVGHRTAVSGIAVSPDGRTLASAGQDGAVTLWHLPTGRELFDLPGGGHPAGPVRFAPDGGALYVGKWDPDPSARQVTWRFDASR
jgi:WD40 repeat protein